MGVAEGGCRREGGGWVGGCRRERGGWVGEGGCRTHPPTSPAPEGVRKIISKTREGDALGVHIGYWEGVL